MNLIIQGGALPTFRLESNRGLTSIIRLPAEEWRLTSCHGQPEKMAEIETKPWSVPNFLPIFFFGLSPIFFFAPDSLMEHSLKITLGVIAGLVATGSYLFNLRKTLFSQGTSAPVAEDR